METALFEQLRKKSLLHRMLLFSVIMVVLYALVYFPLYLYFSSDIAWSGSVLLFLLTELAEPILNYVFYWGAFAFVLYVCVRFSLRDGLPFWIVYAAGVILRYVVQMIVYLAMMGSASWGENFYPLDFLFSVGTDLLLMGAVVFAVWLLQRPKRDPEVPSLAEGLSFSGFFERKNRFLRLTLFAAVLPSAMRLLTRVYYDIYWIVLMGDAVRSVGEVFLMVTYYVADCLSGGIGYLGMVLVLSSFRVSEARTKLKFDEPI